jgi:MFS family permease
MQRATTARYFAGLSRNTYLLACASLFADISTEMLYPLLPIFLTQTLKASGSVVGLVEGVAEATQNIVQGFFWLVVGQAATAQAYRGIAKPLMGLATAWPGVLGARFLDRLGTGARSAPRDALIASSVGDKDRGKAFGLEGIGDNAGAFLGPLIAVVLLIALGLDIRWIFYLAIIPALLAVLMILLVKERQAPATAKAKIDLSLREFPRAYWKYLLATALFGIGNSSNSFLILQTKELGGLSGDNHTDLRRVQSGVGADLLPSRLPFGQKGEAKHSACSIADLLRCLCRLCLHPQYRPDCLLFAGYGLYQGIFRAVGKALATDFVPDRLRGLAGTTRPWAS